MAIQVSGTEVISNSRVLSNVTGLKTVGGTAVLGSGDIAVGGSTTWNTVGTYALLSTKTSTTNQEGGDTYPASDMVPVTNNGSASSQTVSGTWQCMGYARANFGISAFSSTVWIRTV